MGSVFTIYHIRHQHVKTSKHGILAISSNVRSYKRGSPCTEQYARSQVQNVLNRTTMVCLLITLYSDSTSEYQAEHLKAPTAAATKVLQYEQKREEGIFCSGVQGSEDKAKGQSEIHRTEVLRSLENHQDKSKQDCMCSGRRFGKTKKENIKDDFDYNYFKYQTYHL